MTSLVIKSGAIVNLVESPAVAKGQWRWRLQVMADHSHAHIDKILRCAFEARRLAAPETA